MLETIRAYADDQLGGAGDRDTVRQRHADHFLALAERIGSRDSFEANVETLHAEHDNFRAALATFRDTGDVTGQLRLAGALARYWYRGGHHREGLANLEEALRVADDDPVAVACDSRAFASYIATDLGDLARAELHSRAELELARARGGPVELADALLSVACTEEARGRFADAGEHFEQSLSAADDAGYEIGAMVALTHLADLALYEGRLDEAVERLSQSIDLNRAHGWTSGAVAGQLNLAAARLFQAQPLDAASALETVRGLVVERGFPLEAAGWLEAAVAALALLESPEAGARLLGCAEGIRSEIGAALMLAEERLHGQTLEGLHARLAPAELDAAWAGGAAMTRPEAMQLGHDLLEPWCSP
jgi:tetratricopeptide (TPR) repeat protein